MRKLLISAASATALLVIAPGSSFAQFAVDTPVGGVRVGPGYHDGDRYEHRRYHDGDRYEHRRWRDREVRFRSGGCKTITITRDDGSMKRIRKCND